MSRRALMAVVCGVLLLAGAVPVGAPVRANATPSKYVATFEDPYEHIWEAQSLFAGDAGQFEQRVVENEMEMRRDGERYAALLAYQDVIAIADGSASVYSQEAVIELVLKGAEVGAGEAGGTFSGTVTLTGRDAGSVSAALAPPAASGDVAVYDVAGHWGASLQDGLARGELLYETAVSSDQVPVVREVAWFNRSAPADPERRGEPQTFRVAVADGDVHTIDSEDDADFVSGTDEDMEATDGTRKPTNGKRRVTGGDIFAFVKRGLSGRGDGMLGYTAPDAVASARALRDARPAGAMPLPANAVSIDIEYSSAYLDAKNRAAGLTGDEGPVFEGADALTDAVAAMRASAPGIPALPPGVDAGRFWAGFGAETLRPHEDVAGAADLIARLEAVPEGLDADSVLAVRASAMTALAAFRGPFGSVLGGVSGCADTVARSPLKAGPLSDAVLAAARDPRAPRSAANVTAFGRDGALDVERGDAAAMAELPGTVMGGQDGPGIGIDGGERRTAIIDPERWLGYRRADGAVYWLDERDGLALTDASLLGWANSRKRGAFVQADDVGTVFGYAPYGR